MIFIFLKISLLVAISRIVDSFSAETARNQDTSNFQNDNRLNLNDRMSNLEAENMQQKQEMTVMKTKIDENRKEMENLNSRILILEKPETTEAQKSDDIDVFSRSKRPYRLMPAKMLSSSER